MIGRVIVGFVVVGAMSILLACLGLREHYRDARAINQTEASHGARPMVSGAPTVRLAWALIGFGTFILLLGLGLVDWINYWVARL